MDIGLVKIKKIMIRENPDINHTANKAEQTVARQYLNLQWVTLYTQSLSGDIGGGRITFC